MMAVVLAVILLAVTFGGDGVSADPWGSYVCVDHYTGATLQESRDYANQQIAFFDLPLDGSNRYPSDMDCFASWTVPALHDVYFEFGLCILDGTRGCTDYVDIYAAGNKEGGVDKGFCPTLNLFEMQYTAKNEQVLVDFHSDYADGGVCFGIMLADGPSTRKRRSSSPRRSKFVQTLSARAARLSAQARTWEDRALSTRLRQLAKRAAEREERSHRQRRSPCACQAGVPRSQCVPLMNRIKRIANKTEINNQYKVKRLCQDLVDGDPCMDEYFDYDSLNCAHYMDLPENSNSNPNRPYADGSQN